MEIKFQIRYSEEVFKKDVPALSLSARQLIKRAIEERLVIDPLRFGKPLRYSLKNYRSLRVSVYRIIYRIEAKTRTVIIVAIKHRRDAYEDNFSAKDCN